jgi:phospholipid N-methyltransferase
MSRYQETHEDELPKHTLLGRRADLPGCLRFFWAGLAKYLQTGGIVPSQRFLVSRMIAPVPPSYQGRVFELGCGTGALTVRLAARCPNVRILACDLNSGLAEHTRRRVALAGLHRRVTIICDSAERLLKTAVQRGWTKPDYIFSGIPLANLRADRVVALILAVRQALAEDGMYIQFQHSLMDQKRIRDRFPSLQTVPVFLNFPPAVVYYAKC